MVAQMVVQKADKTVALSAVSWVAWTAGLMAVLKVAHLVERLAALMECLRAD